jgi:hypothetical protein
VITIFILSHFKRPVYSGLFVVYQVLAALRRRYARFAARGAGAMLHSVTKIELSGRAKTLTQVSTGFAASMAR